jgi:hypothetical protein
MYFFTLDKYYICDLFVCFFFFGIISFKVVMFVVNFHFKDDFL